MKPNCLKHVYTCLTMASFITFTGCQEKELLQAQFASEPYTPVTKNGKIIPGSYIVIFKDNVNGIHLQQTNELRSSNSISVKVVQKALMSKADLDDSVVEHTYEGAVNGFAAKLTQQQLTILKADPNVAYIEEDQVLALDSFKEALIKQHPGIKKVLNPPNPATSPEPVVNPNPIPVPVPDLKPAPQPDTPPATSPAYKTIKALAGETIPWHIERVGYGDGTGKTVWIIDSGIDFNHSDLSVDQSRSKSFIYNITSAEDEYGHGTTVAGIIGAKNNGTGMIGVASNATLISLRVFDNEGKGTVSRAISAVNHVIANANAGDVVNISLGSNASVTLDNVVLKAAEKGILFAIAAGNSGINCADSSPARVNAKGVYTVSAIDNYNRLWPKSNYGQAVDVAAPGVNITSTKLHGNLVSGNNGSSFAAPHVAGVLLLRGEIPTQGHVTDDKDNNPDPIAYLN